MFDFDKLVLAPCQSIFGRPIVVLPLVSQPNQVAYPARGIWVEKPIDVQMEDGSVLSSEVYRLAVRISDFAAPVEPGDQIIMNNVTYVVDDTDDDGQGATDLTLKEVRP